jgi:hypothetical protein
MKTEWKKSVLAAVVREKEAEVMMTIDRRRFLAATSPQFRKISEVAKEFQATVAYSQWRQRQAAGRDYADHTIAAYEISDQED